MTKQDLIEELAQIAGGLDIAEKRMTDKALREDLRLAIEHMRELVHAESKTPIFISGDPLQ